MSTEHAVVTLETYTTAADAILDRIIHTATRFQLGGNSLRKKH